MAEPASNLAQAIHDIQQSFWDALTNKDKALLEWVLAEDFVARSPGQPDQSRSTFIETLTSFPATVLSVGSDNLQVHLFDEIAVVSGVQVAQLRLPDGNEIADKIALTNIFRYGDGQWQIVLSHAVSLSGCFQGFCSSGT
jgi:ketosteroid isomerase-like protein